MNDKSSTLAIPKDKALEEPNAINNNKKTNSVLSIIAAILAVLASKLCCILPALGVLAGTSSAIPWLAEIRPYRPYLITFSLITLAYAWYRKLRPKKACCHKDDSFVNSKLFLLLITIFVIGAILLPYIILPSAADGTMNMGQ